MAGGKWPPLGWALVRSPGFISPLEVSLRLLGADFRSPARPGESKAP